MNEELRTGLLWAAGGLGVTVVGYLYFLWARCPAPEEPRWVTRRALPTGPIAMVSGVLIMLVGLFIVFDDLSGRRQVELHPCASAHGAACNR